MISTLERKKIRLAKSFLPPFGAEMKKYDELYQRFCREGYTSELCEAYADSFVDNCKKPAADDIIQLASMYGKIHDYKNSEFYLDMLSQKKMNNDDKYNYCLEQISTSAKQMHWRDAEDFRTENINFIQTYMQKKTPSQQVDMYIALALVDCAAKRFSDAFSLLNFGYKPNGKNDEKLLSIMITAVYFYSAVGDEESLNTAVENANSCLKLFSKFEFEWSREYYQKCIIDASNGIL